MATTTEKVDPTAMASIDKGTPSGNLTLLAQAAATEHGLTPLQAIRIYWRAFFWCIFVCIGALLCGYDLQVRLRTFDITHLNYPLGRWRLVEHPPVPHRLSLATCGKANLSSLQGSRARLTAPTPSAACWVVFRWVGSRIGWGTCLSLLEYRLFTPAW